MVPASLPEGVETAVKALKRAKTGLELATRRTRNKLERVPGVPGEKVKEGRVYLVKDKCGICPPCLVKNTCGECSSCQAQPGINTRRQLQEEDHPACLEKGRYCTTWPTEPSVETVSSVVSELTTKSLKAGMKAIEEGLKKLADASADLSYAMQAEGGGPWEGWPELTEEETTKQLEDQQDVVEGLLERGEARQQELIRLEEFDDEEDPEGEVHNDGFNLQEDDVLRSKRNEVLDDAQARLSALHGRRSRGANQETEEGEGGSLDQQHRIGSRKASSVGTGFPPHFTIKGLVATTGAISPLS